MWSHEVAHLQMFVAWLRLAVWRCQKRLMRSYLGFLHWQVHPRGLARPFAAGAYCWLNRDMGGHAPVAVLESLVVLQVMIAASQCFDQNKHRHRETKILGRVEDTVNE